MDNVLHDFKNISLNDYINSTNSENNDYILKTEKERIVSIKKVIESELYRFFLNDSDTLIGILQSYDEIYRSLKETEKLVKKYELFKKKEEIKIVDPRKREALADIIKQIEEDVSEFLTEERYLVYKDVAMMDKPILIILTNDLLILAKEGCNKKYNIMNVMNYNMININLDKDVLNIGINPICYELKKDRKSLEKLVKIIEELRGSIENKEEQSDLYSDKEHTRFLLETGQWELLKNNSIKMDDNSISYKSLFNMIKENNINEIIMKVDNRNRFVFEFLCYRFNNKLREINIVQPLNGLIKSCFEFHEKFYEEENVLIKSIKNIENIQIILTEAHLKNILSFINKRVFSKLRMVEGYLNTIRKYLTFKGVNFEYLMEYFEQEKISFNHIRIEKAKEKISKIINQNY
ncbi:hypothetical protein TCON_0492 [Astathelohania contejeani]|uniref:Uncharacterized protein n=1 Tax=Astathelohania contejeani TaxID=164912 RepID=A0ABQ7I1M9_9MICR|nr:hypothetical protein TCON_0492 [Thelohania contejeani]